jgi:lysophospholipase
MLRAFALAALLVTLAACSRDGAMGPFAESRVPPALDARFYPPDGWAWGFIQTGDKPVQRYGVGSTSRTPLAVVVITPGYGESAEVWFETARALIADGNTVWILDRAGQGGSARYALPRDLGFVPSFDPDIDNLRALVRVVIRPRPETPVVLLGHADGALVALRAVQSGLKVDGVVASAPRLADGEVSAKVLARGIGLGRAQPPGWRPWSRSLPDDQAAGATHDPWRGKVRRAWQLANPDLRLAAPSLGWRNAHQAASHAVEAAADRTRVPVLMLRPTALPLELCRRLPDCRSEAMAGARSAPHIEADPWRDPWMTAVSAFVSQRVMARRVEETSPDSVMFSQTY